MPPSTAVPRPRFFRRHPRLTLVGLVLVLVPSVDLVATVVLRGTGLYSPRALRAAEFRRPDPTYHHALRANVAATGEWGWRRYTMFTNSLGFRDREVRTIALRSESKRLLLLGDSFTEGIGVDYAQTFAGILAERLGQAGTEVLNAGVSSYSPAIYFQRCEDLLEHLGLRFDHLVLCLDISDIPNEIAYAAEGLDGTKRARAQKRWSVKRVIRNHTIVLNGLRDLWRAGTESLAEQPVVLGHPKSSWTKDPEQLESVAKPGLELAAANLDRLHRLLTKHGIEMTLVVYPWPDQIANRERDSIQVSYWRRWATNRGTGFIDVFPAFLDAGPAEEVLQRYFIAGDTHWNEAGHALVAAAIAREIRP